MTRFKTAFRLFLPVLLFVLSAVPSALAQEVTVENVRTDNFPELRFDLRTTDDLVANKARLVVKDNYVVVGSFRVVAGKTSAAGKTFVVSYNVPDPERLDGTTTFEYKGKSITTTYLVKKPTPEQEAAYPKIERTDNTIFYVIGGLGIAAGIAGFVLARRKSRRTRALETPQPTPAPPVPQQVTRPTPPSPAPAAPVATDDASYKPRPQAPVNNGGRIDETLISPGLMPTITIRLNERPSVLTPTGNLQKIGRSPECDMVIPHPTVSKIHASIYLQNDTWWIEDLGSTNGTYADGQRITKAPLHNGSKLYFGQVTGMFNLPQ